MKIIFVDGYNVINNWPNLIPKKDYSYGAARETLIDILQNYANYQNCKVNIVFDAHKVEGSIEKIEIIDDRLSVIFTKDGETADAYIEKMVNELGRRFEVRVVTSDWLEQQTIFQRGAVRVSSREFYHETVEMKEEIVKETKKVTRGRTNRLEDSIDDKEVLRKLELIRRSK